MVDSTVLVERLVSQDDEIKRLTAQVELHKSHIVRIEKDLRSLQGSCKAMGRDLSIARRQKSQYLRALSWLVHNLCIDLGGKPGWLIHTLCHVVKLGDKKLEIH